MATTNALAPDWAIVPKLITSSLFVKLTPESSNEKVELVLSGKKPPTPPRPHRPLPCTIRDPTLGLPGAALDGCNVDQYHCTGHWKSAGAWVALPQRVATLDGQVLRAATPLGVLPAIGLVSLPLQTPLGPPATVTLGQLLASPSGANPDRYSTPPPRHGGQLPGGAPLPPNGYTIPKE